MLDFKTIRSKQIIGVLLLILLLQFSAVAFQFMQTNSILREGILSEAKNVTIPMLLRLEKSVIEFSDILEEGSTFNETDPQKIAAEQQRLFDSRMEILQGYAQSMGTKEFSALIEVQEKLDSLFMVDHQGNIMADIDENQIGQPIQDTILSLVKGKQYQALEEANQIIAFVPFVMQDQYYGGMVLKYSNVAFINERQQILMVSAGLLGVYLLLGFAGAWYLSGILSKPIGKISDAVGRLVDGDGDLTEEIKIQNKDEIGVLADKVNAFLSNIRLIVKDIIKDANELSATADEIAIAATENRETLDSVTEAISEETDAIVSSSEMIQTIAGNLSQTTQEIKHIQMMTNSAETHAEEAGHSVIEANQSMKKLDDSSKEIEGIITVITNIANQTNLLSLNAAIEAAKAGEYGKGFAVVADEVRNLAERSSKAVVEIQNLIHQSSSNVDEGNGVIQKTGTILEKIITHINDVAARINKTSNAIIEQQSGLDEIAKTSDILSHTSENNSAAISELLQNTNQLTGNVDGLSELSNRLIGHVSRFKVD